MDDEKFMAFALKEARAAFDEGEVPIGAVVVKDGIVIACNHNRVENRKSVSAHAEFEAIRDAEKVLNDWRMSDCTLYVTKEPCPMCAGMLVNARIKRIVFGVSDSAAGFCGGALDINSVPGLLWHPEITGGVCADESLKIIRDFFRLRRSEKKNS